MRKDITVSVIGAGRWGQNLIRTFSQLGVLAAIVDYDEARGKMLAESYQVNFFNNIDLVLEQEVTAIAISTPVFTHFELAKKALLAKKDVFIEKPITTSTNEADELLQIANNNKCLLMVGHLLLYQPAIQFIKEFLASGRLGKIHSLRQTRRSLGTIRKEENVLYSFGVHDLAVLNYLIPDPIDNIIASSQTLISEGIADDMSIHLSYQSGIQANLHLSWLWPIKDRHLMILGEKGALHFDEIKQEVTYYQHHGNRDTSITQQGYETIFKDDTPPLAVELQHFLDCIRSRKKPRSCGEQGREVVRLMAEIMRKQEPTYDNKLLPA